MSATGRPHSGPSGVRTQLCVWLECADCGTDSYDDGTPHFADAAEARRQILGEDGYGWTERRDGRLMCRHCSERADCAEQGHEMGEWTRHAGDDEIEWRYCRHCGGAIEDRLVALGWPS